MTHQYMELKIKELEKRIEVLEGEPSIRDELPPVTPKQSGWIPLTYRPATDEEKKDYAERTGYDEEDIDTILNCQLPEDGETVLITDRLGNVETDTFINDCEGCYFECNCDMEDVTAWMPLPKPYVPDTNIGKMSEIPTDCSNLDSCENCKYDDGECCRLLYEAKMESEE